MSRSTRPSPATPRQETLYDQPYEDNKRVRVSRAVLRREPLAAPRAMHDRRGITDDTAASRKAASQQ